MEQRNYNDSESVLGVVDKWRSVAKDPDTFRKYFGGALLPTFDFILNFCKQYDCAESEFEFGRTESVALIRELNQYLKETGQSFHWKVYGDFIDNLRPEEKKKYATHLVIGETVFEFGNRIPVGELDEEARKSWYEYLQSVNFMVRSRELAVNFLANDNYPSRSVKYEPKMLPFVLNLEVGRRSLVKEFLPNASDEEVKRIFRKGNYTSATLLQTPVPEDFML